MDFYLHDTYTLLLMLSIFIIGLLVFNDKERVLFLLQHPFNQKYSLIYHRKDSAFFIFFNSINVLLILCISICFYLSGIGTLISFRLLLQTGIALSLFFGIKCLIIYLLNWIFELNEHSKKYYYGYTSNLMFCGVFFSPIIIFVSYFSDGFLISKFPLFLGYLFFIIYFFLKIILLIRLKLFRISLIFYNILYLCALELLPYLLLFKLLRLMN